MYRIKPRPLPIYHVHSTGFQMLCSNLQHREGSKSRWVKAHRNIDDGNEVFLGPPRAKRALGISSAFKCSLQKIWNLLDFLKYFFFHQKHLEHILLRLFAAALLVFFFKPSFPATELLKIMYPNAWRIGIISPYCMLVNKKIYIYITIIHAFLMKFVSHLNKWWQFIHGFREDRHWHSHQLFY